MSGTNSSSSGGIGLAGATFLVFLTLKLLNKVDWSWWWVTAPLWIPASIAVVFLAVIFVVALIVGD